MTANFFQGGADLPFTFLNIKFIYQACLGAVDIDYLKKTLLLQPSFIRGVKRKQVQERKRGIKLKILRG